MIFDMDGVIVDSMPLHLLAWKQYLHTLGVDISDLERRMHGKRNTELVWDFLGKSVPEEVAVEHGAAKERLFRELMSADHASDFSVVGVNQFLLRYSDVPKAIGSNGEPQNVEFTLDRLGLRSFFPVTVPWCIARSLFRISMSSVRKSLKLRLRTVSFLRTRRLGPRLA